jgi:iron complex outermembrane receptor protein
LGEVSSSGLELEGKVNLTQNWKLLGSYTYNDLEITEDLNADLIGNRPYLIPEHQAALWLEYLVTEGALEGVSIGGGLRHQGESFAANAKYRQGSGRRGCRCGDQLRKERLGAALNVTNLFDNGYIKGCQGLFTCGYGEQRTVKLKVSKSW